MDKEQILAMSREENKLIDEREQQVGDKAWRLGLLCMAVVFIVLFVYQTFVLGTNSYDLLALFSSALMGHSFYQYAKLRKRSFLFGGCCWMLCVILWMIMVFWKG